MLSAYRREYTDFNAASTREYYLFFSGRKPRYEISEIYSRYSDLFSLDAVSRLKKERDEIDKYFETDYRSLDRLIAFASENYLGLKAKELTEEITNIEGKLTIEWDGRSVPYHEIPSLLVNEPNRERRGKLFRSQIRLIGSVNDLRAERIEKLHQLSLNLGYKDYLQMYAQLSQVDYTALDDQMQRFLSNTEKVYTINLERMLA